VYCTNWTIKTYTDYINEPKHLVNPVRDLKMFDLALFEFFSKTPWFVIPIAYAPFELFCIYNSIGTIQHSIMWFTIGMLFWTFAEYVLHRFLFHGEEYWMPYIMKNNFMYAFHFNIHGIHHAFPMDKYRLVFPPTIGYIVLYYMFYLPITKNLAPETAFPLLFGFVVGY
jgi:4-hydroxysphinganine ceramide fatty acyl 2-hydroxylase